MRALIVTEMRRLLARRLFKGLTIIVLAALSIAGVAAFIASEDSPQAIAQARAERTAEIQQCVTRTTALTGTAVDDYPALARTDPQAFCEEQVWSNDPRFSFRDFKWMLSVFAMPLLILAWLVGASFVGAEWHHRTVTTLLTWEPRRVRVMAAKVIAVAGVGFVWIMVLQAMIAASFFPAAQFEGSTQGVDAAWWGDLSLTMLRTGGIATVAALMGLSLATIGRNTAAALGVGFVHLAVIEGLIRAFRPSWMDWLVGENLGLALFGSDGPPLGHSETAAWLLLTAYTVCLVTIATMIFRRRDIA